MQQLTFLKPSQLAWHEVPEPKLLSERGALVRPLAVARCDLDVGILSGKAAYPGSGPFPFGHEFVAEIVKLGENVSGFTLGERVIVPFQISCGDCSSCLQGKTGHCQAVPSLSFYGLGQANAHLGGALSDLVYVPFAQAMLVPLPQSISPAAVASISDNWADAYRAVGPYLEKDPNQSILILGSQSIGIYAIAIARALGANQVTYVDINEERLALAQKAGAAVIASRAGQKFGSYEVTVDASSRIEGLHSALLSTAKGGTCTSIGMYPDGISIPFLQLYELGITLKMGVVHSRATIPNILQLVEQGKLEPQNYTTRIAPWSDAKEALFEKTCKLIIER